MRTLPLAVGRLLAILLLAGCGDSSNAKESGDELSYELFPSTRLLDPADLSALASSSPDGVLVFSTEPPSLHDVAVGQVLLAGSTPAAPDGLLRVVAAIERSDGTLTLRTVAAPPQLAFRKLHAKLRRTVEVADGELEPASAPGDGTLGTLRSRLVGGSGERHHEYELVVFDGDGDEATTNDQVKIDAKLGGAYAWTLAVDVDWGDIDRLPDVVTDCLASVANLLTGDPPSCSIDDLLPEAKAAFSVLPSLSADVDARGAAVLDFKRDFQVGTIHLPPYPLGPLVFTPSIDVLGHVEGGASARFSVGASASAQLESSVVISSRTGGTPQFEPPHLKKHDFQVRPPVVDLHAYAEAKVGSRLSVSLYGIAGPYATANAVARIDAAPLETPCWKVRLALEADLGARITSPNLPLLGYVTLVNWHTAPFRPLDEEVANGSCLVPEDPPPPPGGGPSVRTYQSPPFEPWAKVLGGEVDGTSAPAVGTLQLGSPSLVPSIDGRWIAAGAFETGLHKIDGDGSLIWTSTFGWDGDRKLRVLRSIPTSDAGLLALLRAEDDAAFVLAKTTQAGALVAARAYVLPADCVPVPTELVRDAGDGFVVLGRCLASGRGWMAHLDVAGEPITARLFESEGAERVEPFAATVSDGEVVISGRLQRPAAPDELFVARLAENDRLAVTTAFHCPTLPTLEPMAMAPSEDGGVTVVGTANGLGLVARVRRDGALGFARFPNLGEGVPDVLVVSAVAELPSTGMVIAASTGDATSADPPSVVVAGLDGAGRAIWANRYSLASPSPRALVWPALRLTDDGGAIVAAIAGPQGGRAGDLVAMKIHAKDGWLGNGQAATSEPVALGEFACTPVSGSLALQQTELSITARPIALTGR